MRVNCRRCLPILVLSGLLTAIPSAPAATAAAAPPPAKAPSTYPQIVRLSYVQGDVRVSRGKLADKEHDKQSGETTGWEQAVTDLPLEAGYSLVTGAGRAEIEFEDASTVYLGDNSVLTFNQLSTTGGVPHTEMALLSGTATLNVQTMVQGEAFNLNTPTESLWMKYPQKAYMRIDSYLDAMAVTPQEDLTFRMPGLPEARTQTVGQTFTFRNGHRVPTPTPADAARSSEWDNWVAARVVARDAAMSAAMKDAGLTAPVPGLDQINGQGQFFACEPYGTCWEPAHGWDGHEAEAEAEVAQLQPQQPQVALRPDAGSGAERGQVVTVQQLAAQKQASPSSFDQASPGGFAQFSGIPGLDAQTYLATHPGAILRVEDYAFPCSAYAVRYLVAVDPVTGEQTFIAILGPRGGYGSSVLGAWYLGLAGYPYLGSHPWNWAVCHTGSFVRWQHRYVWVAGGKRHHHRPIRWVKSGHTVGFVPIHPRDVAGKPPLNLKHGVFTATGKGGSIERVDFDAGKPVKLLDEAPKEFRNPYLVPLQSVQAPHPEAHAVFTAVLAAGGSGVASFAAAHGSTVNQQQVALREQGTPILFDRKSQSFMVARQVVEGGRSTTVAESLGGRTGDLQAHNGQPSSMVRGSSYSGSVNPSSGGSSSAGSFSHGSSPAPSYSGGGGGGGSFHSGGGGAPSGGGGGGGGGGSASSSAHK